MTQEPKKLPNWLRGKKKQQQEEPPAPQAAQPPPPAPEPPQQSAPPSAPSDDSALPPWLRTDAPPPPTTGTPSKLKRLAPPPPEQPGGIPPWLAGMEEKKSYKIGGKELSEEFLKGGDELPDTLDSEMTFDSWMADQLESKREKDIEEEVPDLLSSIIPDDLPARPDASKQTGQLPDWFLGLEELKVDNAPDWFNPQDADSSKVDADAMPPWISDMVETPAEPEPVDEIGSFFDSLGVGLQDEEETPEVDWFNQPEEEDETNENDDIPGVPTDDFFAQLVGKGRSTPPAQPPTPKAQPPAQPPPPKAQAPKPPADVKPAPSPQIELPDIDDFDEDEPAQAEALPTVEIPQNELDAFFDNVATDRSSPSLDDIEDPDLDWIVPSEPVAEEVPDEPEIVIDEAAGSPSEDTMSWLNQLENIVSAASRPVEPPPEEVVSLGTKETWDVPAPGEGKSEQEDFAWPDLPAEEPVALEEPEETETQETEWLSGISADDEPSAEAPAAEAPPARTSLLRSRLYQEPKQPTAETPAPEESDLPQNLFDDAPLAAATGDEPLIPEEELQTGWLTDDLFGDEPAAATSNTATDDDDFFNQLQTDADANVLQETAQPSSSWGGGDDVLADTDFLNGLGLDDTDEPNAQEDDFFASLNVSDQADNPSAAPTQYGQWDTQPTNEAAPLEDDFFASLGISDEQSAQPAAASEDEQFGQWIAEQPSETELQGDDIFAALGMTDEDDDQAATAPQGWDAQPSSEDAEPLEDDFFASLGMTDEDNNPPAAATQDDPYGQWKSQQPNEAGAPEDDFFAQLNVDEDDEQPTAATQGWDAEPSNEDAEPLPDDFFAALGMSEAEIQAAAATEEDQFGQWSEQQGEPEAQEDDFLASLGVNIEDEDQPPAQAEAGQYDQQGNQGEQEEEVSPLDDDFFARMGITDQDNDQPDAASEENRLGQSENWQKEASAQEDDFFARLGMNDEADAEPTAVSEDDQFGQWGTQQPSSEASSLDDDFLATFGMTDEQDTQPVASEEDQFGQWGTQQASEELPQTDDFFAALGVNDQGNELPAASEEDQFGQWGMQQASEELPQTDDFFAAPGMNDEDDQPSAAGSEAEAYGQWGSQQPNDEDEAVPDNFFDQFGTDDEDDEAPAAPEEDQFGQWNSQRQNEEDAQGDSFLASLGFKEDDNSVLPSEDNPLAGWGDQEQPAVAPLDEDFFASLSPDAQPADAEQDPYAQWEVQTDAPPTDDFFAALGMISEGDLPDEAAVMPSVTPPEGDDQGATLEQDFFASLGTEGDDPPSTLPMPGRKSEPQPFGDVDSYLASLNVGEPDLTPGTDALFGESDSMDLDALFSEPVMPDRPKTGPLPGAESLPGANEDWLNQLQASVGEVSASAIVRQKEDRPVEELSDRLKKLRQRAEQMPDEAPTSDASTLTDMLPGGATQLSAAPFIDVEPTPVGTVALTSEQQAHVDLLKTLVPTEDRGQTRISAIEATYDSPFMTDLEDSEESIVVPPKPVDAPARPRTRRRQYQRIRLDRVLIAALIVLAVIVPFTIRGFRVGDLPPSSFAAGSSEQTAFNQINGLKAGDLVLVGLEYGPTSAAELDGMTTALLRHILMKAAYPVIVSGNPLTILRSQDLMASINADSAFLQRIDAPKALAANSDYYIVRYLPGSVIGLRAFSQDTANLVLSDVQGQATNLVIRSLHDFALVTLVTDRAEDMRSYAEQIAIMTRAPLIAAVSYGAAPLAEPYARTSGGGLLVGYKDAYTYTNLLDSVSARSITQHAQRVIPADISIPVPAIPQLGIEPIATATQEATAEAGGTSSTTQTLGTATVISSQAVNMRSGPGTTNDVIAAVPSGTTMDVLEFNVDRSWVHVRLNNGQEGWISAGLLSVNVKRSSREVPETHAKRQQLDPGNPTDTPRAVTQVPAALIPSATPITPKPITEAASTAEAPAETQTVVPPTATQRPTATATPTATPTLEPTEEATVEVVVAAPPLPPPSPGYRDERWYAMNLGIIASTLVITLGAVVNILRGLLRRGRGA